MNSIHITCHIILSLIGGGFFKGGTLEMDCEGGFRKSATSPTISRPFTVIGDVKSLKVIEY
jgi:hypothetical protein